MLLITSTIKVNFGFLLGGIDILKSVCLASIKYTRKKDGSKQKVKVKEQQHSVKTKATITGN